MQGCTLSNTLLDNQATICESPQVLPAIYGNVFNIHVSHQCTSHLVTQRDPRAHHSYSRVGHRTHFFMKLRSMALSFPEDVFSPSLKYVLSCEGEHSNLHKVITHNACHVCMMQHSGLMSTYRHKYTRKLWKHTVHSMCHVWHNLCQEWCNLQWMCCNPWWAWPTVPLLVWHTPLQAANWPEGCGTLSTCALGGPAWRNWKGYHSHKSTQSHPVPSCTHLQTSSLTVGDNV